jgi:hypothetical protein
MPLGLRVSGGKPYSRPSAPQGGRVAFTPAIPGVRGRPGTDQTAQVAVRPLY